MLIPDREDRTSRGMRYSILTLIRVEVKIHFLLDSSPWYVCLPEHTLTDCMQALNSPAKSTAFSVTIETWIYCFITSDDDCVISKMSLFTVDFNLWMKASYLRMRLSKTDDTKQKTLWIFIPISFLHLKIRTYPELAWITPNFSCLVMLAFISSQHFWWAVVIFISCLTFQIEDSSMLLISTKLFSLSNNFWLI